MLIIPQPKVEESVHARPKDEADANETPGQDERNSAPVFGPERPPPQEANGNVTEDAASKPNGARSPRKETVQPRQNHHEYTVEERLKNDLHYYKVELEAEYNRRKQVEQIWEAEQLEIRRLRKVEQDFQKLQNEKLQSMDRFQPKFDSDFISALDEIDRKMMKSLVTFLTKSTSQLEGPELSAKIKHHLWLSPYDREEDQFHVKDKDLRRKMLKSMIWKFLQRNLFARPFMCFGGEAGELAHALFSTLYHKPCKSNIPWGDERG